MNIDDLELTMEEIFEMVMRCKKDGYIGSARMISYNPVLREHVLRLPISGHDFFGKYVWNCKTLIDNGIVDRTDVEKYVQEKIKFINAAFDNFECFKKIEEE